MISPICEGLIFMILRICEVLRKLNPRENFRIYSIQGSYKEGFIKLKDFSKTIYPLYTGNLKMCTLVNSEDPDEIQHNAAFHLVGWLVGYVVLRPKSTAMVIAGRSVHLTTLFPGQA